MLLVLMKSGALRPFQGSRHMDHTMPKDLQGQELLSSPGQGDELPGMKSGTSDLK